MRQDPGTWSLELIPFLPQKVRQFFKNIHKLKFCGKIVEQQYCKNRKQVMIPDPTVRFEYAADHEFYEFLQNVNKNFI